MYSGSIYVLLASGYEKTVTELKKSLRRPFLAHFAPYISHLKRKRVLIIDEHTMFLERL